MRTHAAAHEWRHRVAAVVAAAVGVSAVLAGIAVVAVVRGGSTAAENPPSAAPAVVRAVTSVPKATVDAVGAGSVVGFPQPSADSRPLTVGGKPAILYVGGEFCPFCAAERWSVVQALSRFGSWHGLTTTFSSEGNLPTFGFRDARYTSDYVAFVGKDISDQEHRPLDMLTADERARFLRGTGGQGGFPFLAIGGRYDAQTLFDPGALAGKDATGVAAGLGDPDLAATRGVVGGANVLTAAVCRLTGGAPAGVCTAPGVVEAGRHLDG